MYNNDKRSLDLEQLEQAAGGNNTAVWGVDPRNDPRGQWNGIPRNMPDSSPNYPVAGGDVPPIQQYPPQEKPGGTLIVIED